MIYFFYGKNDFLSYVYYKKTKEKLINQQPNLLIETWEKEKNWSVAKIEEILTRQGLFQQKQLVIFKNYQTESSLDEQKKLKSFLQKTKNIISSPDVYLIFWERKNVLKSNVLTRFLLKNAQVKEFKPLVGKQIDIWIEEYLGKYQQKIDQKGLQELILRTKGNLWEIYNELNKLINYNLENKEKVISQEDVILVKRRKSEDNIFKVVEALSNNHKKQALELLHQQLAFGDNPLKILSMYVYQFRSLLKVADFYFQGISDKNLIAKETKLHPYVVQKSIWNLKNISLKELKKIYQKLAQIDYEIKTGQIEAEIALDLLIAVN